MIDVEAGKVNVERMMSVSTLVTKLVTRLVSTVVLSGPGVVM